MFFVCNSSSKLKLKSRIDRPLIPLSLSLSMYVHLLTTPGVNLCFLFLSQKKKKKDTRKFYAQEQRCPFCQQDEKKRGRKGGEEKQNMNA